MNENYSSRLRLKILFLPKYCECFKVASYCYVLVTRSALGMPGWAELTRECELVNGSINNKLSLKVLCDGST